MVDHDLRHSDIEDIAERAAQAAVRSTLLTLGIDVDDPLSAQRDFAVLREVGQLVMDPEFRKDIEHTRAWRLAMAEGKKKGLLTIVGILVAGTLGALWLGIKTYLHLPLGQ